MSEPMRKYYISTHFLPSIKELTSFVKRDKHLVLSFPYWMSRERKEQLVNSLQSNMPENYSVFDAGCRKYWNHITVKEVISELEIDKLIPDIVNAAKEFRRQSEFLAKGIAKLNNVPITSLWEKSDEIDVFPIGWKCSHHGQHYYCENIESGQVIEVPIWYGEEFGVLDPYFFSQFIDSTQSLNMPTSIVDWYHDMSRVMDTMLKKGLMKQVKGTKFEVSGIVIT